MGSGTSLEHCDRTDVGRRRANNQDAKAVLEPWSREQYRRRGWLFVVADGMGAHAAGEMASAIAAEQVPLVYEKHAARSPLLALRTSIEQANAEIHARGESSPDLKGMGTTCTALAILPRGAIIGHVGDSRAYRVRGGTIEQLSKDHSLVWELEAAHTGAPEDMPVAPKNIITRSLGPHPQVEIDVEGPFPVEENDVFVLCSDGLSGQVADDEIGLLASSLPPKAAATTLVGLALVRGAPDNVTVITARAGEREVSRTAPGDEPWPLAEEPSRPVGQAVVPWTTLAIAGGCLFTALLLYPNGALMSDIGPVGRGLGELREPIGWVAFSGLLLGFVGAIIAALVGFCSPPTPRIPRLALNARIGAGPYRTYACSPTVARIEGVVASVESAADGLDDPTRTHALGHVRRAREAAAAGDFATAVTAAADAVSVYARSVEAARR
ncbi:MAG: protein phosphatase 2C domain-containing protein [Pirellulales bacterium]